MCFNHTTRHFVPSIYITLLSKTVGATRSSDCVFLPRWDKQSSPLALAKRILNKIQIISIAAVIDLATNSKVHR